TTSIKNTNRRIGCPLLPINGRANLSPELGRVKPHPFVASCMDGGSVSAKRTAPPPPRARTHSSVDRAYPWRHHRMGDSTDSGLDLVRGLRNGPPEPRLARVVDWSRRRSFTHEAALCDGARAHVPGGDLGLRRHRYNDDTGHDAPSGSPACG